MNSPSLPPDLARTLEAGLAELALDTALATPLLAYLELLARWNRTYNLTAVRDPGEMVVKHLLDSLAMHPFVDPLVAGGGALADLGTGAGLPGIPLAIVKPGLRVTLVESAGKKARFLREA
ncbi:MAG TPA: 16S rRNA (guanine(527)-N(7))-methyltransferase RsmG, partial [Lysobacter sp.]